MYYTQIHAHNHTIFRIHKQTHTYTHTHKVAFCCFEVSLVVNHTQLSKVDAKKKSTASPSSLQKLILSAAATTSDTSRKTPCCYAKTAAAVA